MKHLIIILLLSSCYSQKLAEKSINKAKINYPDLVAKKSSEWFPCDTIVKKDSTEYIKWIKKIDTLNQIQLDTIIDTLVKFKESQKLVFKYRTLLKTLPVIHDTIKLKNTAKESYLIGQFESKNKEWQKLNKDYKNSLKVIIWLFVMLLLFGLVLYIKK
jgi:hypothetical protein